MSVTAVAFDLDYTLAVPKRPRQTLLREATEAADAPDLSREEYLDAHSEHLTDETRAGIFETALEAYDTHADPETLASEYRERIAETLVPAPGAAELLADLRTRYRVGLLTNGPTVAQREKLATLGWEDAFDVALVSGDLPAGKPDRQAFEALLAELGTAPEETVYVGDNVEADVTGAADAGLVPIQVTFDGGPDPDSRAFAHVPRDELATELPQVLERLQASTAV